MLCVRHLLCSLHWPKSTGNYREGTACNKPRTMIIASVFIRKDKARHWPQHKSCKRIARSLNMPLINLLPSSNPNIRPACYYTENGLCRQNGKKRTCQQGGRISHHYLLIIIVVDKSNCNVIWYSTLLKGYG